EHVELQAGAIGDDLRRLATGIYPKTLVDRGLTEALQEAILESGDRVELVGDAGRLPAQIEQALYFCALEAVQNAVRHAGSWARVEVSLVRSARDVDLEVVDNGVGFDLDGVARGLGL